VGGWLVDSAAEALTMIRQSNVAAMPGHAKGKLHCRVWKGNFFIMAVGLFEMEFLPDILEAIRQLQNELGGWLGRVSAMDEFIVAFKQQCAGDVIDVTQRAAVGGVAHAVTQ